ncbi:MAG: PAC2 family protein [Candidatus Methanospirare jalkutatii]|nr:MAG: PAC2 family protein [Candidatus Methanospirare jalkutatii]
MSGVFEVSELTILWDTRREELKRLRIPILVAGFKITGNAATYYLKESLSDVERAFRLYSHYFPPISMVSNDKFSIIHEELWFSRSKKLYIYRAEGVERLQGYRGVQSISPEVNVFLYKYARQLVEIFKDLGVKEIYTVGSVMPVQPKGVVHVAFYEGAAGAGVGVEAGGEGASEEAKGAEESSEAKELPRGAKRIKREGFDAFLIEGEDALLPGFAAASGIASYTLMAEERHFLDLNASITVLEAFREMSGVDIDMDKVREIAKSDIEKFEQRMKEYQQRMMRRQAGRAAEGGAGLRPSMYL